VGVRAGEDPLDAWSLVHVASGLALGLPGWPWWLVLLLLVAFEALEGVMRRIRPGGEGLFEYESWPNVGMDVVVGMAGFAVASLIVWHRL